MKRATPETKYTPPLTGKDSDRFRKAIENPERVSEEEMNRILSIAKAMNRKQWAADLTKEMEQFANFVLANKPQLKKHIPYFNKLISEYIEVKNSK